MMVNILLPVIGAIISRWHGGGFFRFSKVCISLIWALPFVYLVWQYNYWLVIPAFVLCALGKSTGHGNWFDLANAPQGDRERLEFIIRPLYGKIPEYWYDVLGLAVVGVAAVSGGLLIAPYNQLGALAILAGGLMKPIGYMIGWRLFTSPKSTEFGEYWTGFFAYLPLAFIL